MAIRAKADASALREAIYDKGSPTRTDLVALMTIGIDAGDEPEFLALVADVARDAVVAPAQGRLDEEDADWLTARLGDGGGLVCRSEFEALRAVIEAAASVPYSLVAFAVREVERAILTGRRGSLGGADDEPGVIAPTDAAALAAFCFPAAAEPRPTDRATAEALFDIAHATAAAANNDSAFADLFARAVGDYLASAAAVGVSPQMSASAWRGVLSQFLGALAGELLADDVGAPPRMADRLAEDRYFEEYRESEARRAAVARVEAGDARWALAHLTRGGPLTSAERRLLARLRAATGDAPGPLAGLFEHAA